VSDEIAKLKYKEPQSTKIVQLEQELVRAEAQSLVAEAQLANVVSRALIAVLTSPNAYRHARSSRRPMTTTLRRPLSAPRSR